MLPHLTKIKGMALDLLFPRWCVGCGREGDFICPACLNSLPRITPPLCPRCGLPQPSDSLCPACLGWPAQVDGIRAPFRFEGVVRQAVHQLKYQNLRALSGLLAQLLHEYLVLNPIPGELLIPVPLHPKRLRERGYNQSRLLANELGKLAGLPVAEGYLVRQRHSLPQARTASVGERRDNVADAFACRDRRLKGRAVIVIDDVATSGATLDACARVLKRAGAASVWGLALAREL